MAAGDTNEVLLTEGNIGLTEVEEADALEQKARKDKRYRKNQRILIITTTAFFFFVIAEIVGALISGSLSLLGDAGAMSVDVFTVRFQLRSHRLNYRYYEHNLILTFFIRFQISTCAIFLLSI